MFRNFKIRHKLLLMVLIPVVALLIFSVYNTSQHYLLLQGIERTETDTRLAAKICNLVHELQKERGYSSGYLNAKGGKYREQLTRQHAVVDNELQKVNDFVAGAKADLAPLRATLYTAGRAAGNLGTVREQVKNLKLSSADSAAYYSDLINSYTDVIATSATETGNSDVMRLATAYYAFIKAKEETGKERAMLTAVLIGGTVDQVQLRRIFSAQISQNAYLDVFRRYGSREAVAAFDEKAQGAPFRNVEALRDTVLSKGTAALTGITPETCFGTFTAKMDSMKEIEDLLTKEILVTAGQLAVEAKTVLLLNVSLTSLLIAVIVLLGFGIMKSINKPLSRMLHMLQDIAEGEGDLTKRLAVERKDELGEVSVWFNRFVDSVHGIVTHLAKNTSELSSSCQRLNRNAEQIATAAEEVAAQSGTVATASEEMSTTSNEISSNCLAAVASSSRASDTADSGAAVVQATLAGMERIAARVRESARTVTSLGERSEQIGTIVGTIEEIADQTNLLALNAAIEAARAGDQGRGFAVVADEVRALAERTTRATKEIGEMIKAIQSETTGAVGSMRAGVEEVEKGMEHSRKSGQALQGILAEMSGVTAQIHQIATAAEEQTAVTGEISSNIHQINDVIFETAKDAHDTANAAGDLTALAVDLQQIVGRFKLA